MTTNGQNIETLQEAFSSRSPHPPTQDCPEPQRLWAAVRGELAAEERRSLVRHTATCAACAEDWRVSWALLREERQAEAESCGEPTSPPNRVVSGPARWFGDRFSDRFAEQLPVVAAAAMVLVAVGLGVVLNQSPETEFRGEGISQVNPSVVPESQPRGDFVLAWPEVAEGATYTVEILSPERDVLDMPRGLTEPRFRLGPDLLEGIEAGGEIQWIVTVYGPAGQELEHLGPYRTLLVD